MTARVNWKQVAQQLAIQMSSHAQCDQHPASDPDAECPFCADRAAYQVWLNAGGRDFSPVLPKTSVSIAELMRRSREEDPCPPTT
jgi:hypothetical protein